MKLIYTTILFLNTNQVISVKRNSFIPTNLVPSTSSWRKQFGVPAQPSLKTISSNNLGHSLIASSQFLDNSIINSSPENNFSIETKKEQTENHANTAEVVRKSDASLIWRRTLAGHVNSIQDNKDIEGYFHVKNSITEALDYYFSFKDGENNQKHHINRRRKRDSGAKLSGGDFIDYGCWCNRVRYLKDSKEFNLDNNSLKGGKVVDEIDRVCQDWTKCMRCVSITNSKTFEEAQQDQSVRNFQQSNCQFDKMTFAFGIRKNGELTCSDPSNHVRSCAYQTCMCNLDLIHKLTELRHTFEADNSRYNREHVGTCNYQRKEKISETQQMQESGLSIDGFYAPDANTRSSGSLMASNNDAFLDDYWSFDYDNTKSEDTDYYDSNPASVHNNNNGGDNLNGPRATSAVNRPETQCCGSVPSWRPYKTNNKQCCQRNSLEGSLRYWIAKKDVNACQNDPPHFLR